MEATRRGAQVGLSRFQNQYAWCVENPRRALHLRPHNKLLHEETGSRLGVDVPWLA